VQADRRAAITRVGSEFRWRAYVAVRHRTPRARQKFRPVCEVQSSRTLTDAKKAARALLPMP
jgi:hypothetical protein